MPNDPSRPSWKGEDRSALPSGRQSRVNPQHTWKTGGGHTPAAPPGRKLKVTLLSGLGVLVMAGLVWYVLLLTRTRQTCLAVIAADFRQTTDDLSLPLNIYGDRAGRDFLSFAKAGDRSNKWYVLGDRAAPWPVDPSRPESNWLRGLASRPENTLIVFFAQPGTTDDQGRPVLITDNGDRFEVVKILQELKKLPDKKKLLIFDSTQTPSDWRRGVLLNLFDDGLIKIKDDIAGVPNLLVLSASSPGQRSWVSEEYGHSIFTHYLLDGLAGGAIAKRGGPIYAAELFQFVRTKTDDWVQRNRADNQRPFRQQPMLLPEDAEKTSLATGFLLGYGDPAYAGESAPALRTMNSDTLKEAWKRCDGLAEKTPAPWVSTPRLWRRYRELLQRYETMLRAGETDAAGKLQATIEGLAKRIDDARAAPGAVALSASLSLPAALGLDRSFTDTQMTEIAARKSEEVAAGIKALGGDETVARIKYLGFLVKRLAETPGQLADFTGKMMSADDGGKNRPSEAHLAIMLNKYEQPGWQKPTDDLIALAIKMRQLGEETALSVGLGDGYPYSERLPGGLWNEIKLADRDRRQGEDLLFAATSSHAKARELLEKARTRYEDIRKLETPVRTALAIRDLAFADLPGLTDWVALARPAEPTPQKLESLWAEAHNLADRLTRLDPLDLNAPPARDSIEAPKNEPAGRDLAMHAEIVRKGLEELKLIYSKAVAAEVQSNITTQTARQQIEYALAAPNIKAEDRVRLVGRSRDISAKLARETPLPVPGEALTEADLARNQPQLARAVIGDRLLKANAQSDGSLRPVEELRANLDPSFGGQLFIHWKKLLTEPDVKNKKDTADTPIPLPWRERMALVAGTDTAPKPEPAELARAERWRNTFRRLASRVELDHWYDEKNQPDFKRLAEMFYRAISDAEFAEQAGKLENTRVRGQLILDAPAERTLTTERDLAPKFELHALPENLEPGFATLAPKLNRADVLRFKKDPVPYSVTLIKDSAERVPLTTIKPLDNSPEVPDLALAMNAYYRGQFAKQALAKLPVRPFPDLVINKSPPVPGAQVAARADDDLDLGAIAIIFDCSGSMNDGGKFAEAKQALRQFQGVLPKGALVTLWAYGHDREQLDDIEHLMPGLTEWNPNDPRVSNLLFEKVRDLKARSFTPLLDTMIRAADDADFKNAAGFKTLLILTDGCHQKKQGIPTPADNEAVAADFRKEFVDKDRKVSIRMVLFAAGQGANVQAQAAAVQFRDMKSVKTPSKLYEAVNAKELFEQLAESVRPRVEIYRNNRLAFEFLAKRPRELLEWHPEPPLTDFGEYEASVRGNRQKIYLEAGDRLAMRIRRASTGIKIVRLLQADEPERSGWRPLAGLTEDEAYVLSLVNNRIDESGTSMKGRFALEDRRSARADSAILRLERPRFVWWEFRAVGSKAIPPRSYVNAITGQPAPVWELGCERWPVSGGNRAKPAVEVWASASDPTPADVRELPPGEVLVDVPADGNAAILESVGFEDADIAVNATGQISRKNCLVVRIHAPQGTRYFAEVGGVVYAETHKYFFDAKRYTAVFSLPAEAKDRPLRLKLIAVEAVKANPQTKRLFRELTE